MHENAAANTDREIYREPDKGCGSFYSDSIHVTQRGGVGINCGGTVIVMPLREWHKMARAPEAYANVALSEENDRLHSLLERCHTILWNMAKENEGAIFRRWPINHEPLRADARGLLPEINRALGFPR